MLRAHAEVPKGTWSLERLKSWLQVTSKRWALDAYYMGLALNYARPQLKEDGLWMEFCRDACPGYSYETMMRWVRLAESVKDPVMLDGIRLTEAYERVGIVQPKTRVTPDQISGDTADESKVPVTESTANVSGESSAPGTMDNPQHAKEVVAQREAERRPGVTLTFFARKVVEKLAELKCLPKKERWQDVDVEEVRTNLTELLAHVEHALKELPKMRSKAE